jgi:hypothetical protein
MAAPSDIPHMRDIRGLSSSLRAQKKEWIASLRCMESGGSRFGIGFMAKL